MDEKIDLYDAYLEERKTNNILERDNDFYPTLKKKLKTLNDRRAYKTLVYMRIRKIIEYSKTFSDPKKTKLILNPSLPDTETELLTNTIKAVEKAYKELTK